jgi:hypothetical protein
VRLSERFNLEIGPVLRRAPNFGGCEIHERDADVKLSLYFDTFPVRKDFPVYYDGSDQVDWGIGI